MSSSKRNHNVQNNMFHNIVLYQMMTFIFTMIVLLLLLLCIIPNNNVHSFPVRAYSSSSLQQQGYPSLLSSSSSLSLSWSSSSSKTYGKSSNSVINDIIDEESAMMDFFTNRIEWYPIFCTLAGKELPTDTFELLKSIYTNNNVDNFNDRSKFDFHENTSPWKKNVEPIPTNDNDRTVLSKFLDSMQESLLDIPVTADSFMADTITTTNIQDENNQEKNDEDNNPIDDYLINNYDDNDMHFIEEGRRLLALSRFFVFRSSSTTTIDDNNNINENDKVISFNQDLLSSNNNNNNNNDYYNELFNLCWSELIELRQADVHHTGTIILLPDYQYHISDLRRFTDMNLIRPLQWLGLYNNNNNNNNSMKNDAAITKMSSSTTTDNDNNNKEDVVLNENNYENIFEIVSFHRHSPAIRLLYKLKET